MRAFASPFSALACVALLAACGPAPSSDASDDPSDDPEPPPCAPHGGDTDDDGICDAFDNCVAVENPEQKDADDDGRGDACDFVDGTAACVGLGGDEDGDDVCAAFDNCPETNNASQRDLDLDGIGDACDPTDDRDPCVGQGHDDDGDGICSAFDNCVDDENPDQLDSDADGLGDACDPSIGPDLCAGRGHDDDGDGVCSAFDNCPDHDNADQRDADGDGLGDACDPTPAPCDDHGGDEDLDTICSDFDNCPGASNITQLDLDHDGIGDACDPTPPPAHGACDGLCGDSDGDDYCALHDNCPLDANPSQRDTDGDGIGDACDTEECDGVDNDGDGLVDEDQPDTDGDGVADCTDVCPGAPDTDGDGDGLADCVDACPLDPLNDGDGDGICGDVDNCPTVANGGLFGQRDDDGDGIGNACDVEECDGVNNDNDNDIDEGLPDGDDDGLCDDIDPCPEDPLNDDDGDGVCGLVDNCPGVANPGQEDGDGDGVGDACDLNAPASCDPAAVLAAPGAVPMPAALHTRDVVARPGSDVVLVSVAADDPDYPDSVVAVDAPSASVLWSVFVGNQPLGLALSDDSTLLYVALDGTAAVRAVDVAERRACRSFPLGMTQHIGPLFAGDLAVLPGTADTVVVSTRRKGVSPDIGGVFVYDSGHRRPVGTQDHTGARVIEMASDGRVFGYNNSTTEFGFRELEVSQSGIDEIWLQRDVVTGVGVDIHYSGGRVYATSGAVVDVTATPALAGSFGDTGLVAVEPSTDEAFLLIDPDTISVYSTTTFVLQRQVQLPTVVAGARRMVRWGNRGLAIAGSDKLLLVADAVSPPGG